MRNELIFGMIVILCAVFARGADDACIPDWSCVDWSDCVGNNQTRICNDLNFCGIEDGKPSESRRCVSESAEESSAGEEPISSSMPSARICLEDWKCSPWQECISGSQARECTDNNACGTFSKKPVMEQTCVISAAVPETEAAVTPAAEEQPSSVWTYLLWFFVLIFLGAIGIVAYAYFTPSTSSSAAQTASLDPELSKYVFQMRSAGYSNEQIRHSMLNSGYQNEIVDRYLPPQNPQLRGYTRQMLEQGYNAEQIEDHLLRHGMNPDEVRMNISLSRSR